MTFYNRQSQRLELRTEQRMQLRQELRLQYLIQQVQKQCLLKDADDDIPDAKFGLEGMEEASRILKEKGLAGILIGGLGRDLYSNQPSEEALNKLNTHKDVDVLVFPPRQKIRNSLKPFNTSKLFKKFEGGIDWWHLKDVEVIQDKNGKELYQQGFYNGNNCQSFFSLRSEEDPYFIGKTVADYEPGLYILPQRFYENMFFAQKELEMSKLYPDFETFKEYISSPNTEKKLIPEVARLFEICDGVFAEYKRGYHQYFHLNPNNLGKVWTKQQGNLKLETEKRKKLRIKLNNAATSEEKQTITKQLSQDLPARKKKADKLHELRTARDKYLEIRSDLKRKSLISKGKE